MALTPGAQALARVPPELLRAVADEAERDADRACLFVRELGLAPEPGEVRRLPADFLLDLGAALRLLFWERAGFTLHLGAGLPPALEATHRVFLEAAAQTKGPARPPFRLAEAVFRLSVDHFAWAGRHHLNADILLDTPDEDALVESLARLLWDHRHAPRLENAPGTQP